MIMYDILVFVFFTAGTALSLYGMNLYGKVRGRYGGYTKSFDPVSSKTNNEETPQEEKDIINVAIYSSILLIIAMLMKSDHFARCAEVGYEGEYIWIAPILVIFNIFSIISSYCLIKKYNNSNRKKKI